MYNQVREIEDQWVFGGIERETRRSFIEPLESQDSETLLNILKEWVGLTRNHCYIQ